MTNFTKKREEQILQLSNDISEDMDLDHWTRKDLVDAITFWNDRACEEAQKKALLLSTIQIGLAKLTLDIMEQTTPK